MTDDHSDFPEQEIPLHLSPLFKGPIEIAANDDDLAHESEIAQRLDALLAFYGFEASPDGWRLLALRLAMDHQIAGKRIMEIREAGTLDVGAGGREPGERWGWHLRLNAIRSKPQKDAYRRALADGRSREEAQEIKRTTKPLGQLQAANALVLEMTAADKAIEKWNRTLRGRYEPEAKRIKIPDARAVVNWFSKPPGAPVEIERGPLTSRALRIMQAAAKRLENS